MADFIKDNASMDNLDDLARSVVVSLNDLSDVFANPADEEHENHLAEAILRQSDYYKDDQEIIDWYGEEYLAVIKQWRKDNQQVVDRAVLIAGRHSA